MTRSRPLHSEGEPVRRARRGRVLAAVASWLVIWSLLLAPRSSAEQSAAGSGAGLIYGTLYTAKQANSIAPGVGIALIYRDARGERHQVEARTDDRGRFSFPGLPTDGGESYVLRVQGAERPFLSSPLQFEAGQQRLLFNFVAPGPLPAPAHASPVSAKPTSNAAERKVAPTAPAEVETSSKREAGPMNECLVLLLVLCACAALGFIVRRRKPRSTNPAGGFECR
jgi:hypothetical protein